MRPSLPPFPGGASPRPGLSSRSIEPGPPARSPVRVLLAGVDRDARGPVEAAVRRAFAGRPPEEAWSVSLVRLPGRWSVTLNGPGEAFRSLSFTAEEQSLARAIGEAIGGDGVRRGPASESEPPPRGPVEDHHTCPRCGKGIRLTYEEQPGEPKERAPVACPHCWAVGHVEIGAWAVSGGDYRAEKA